VYRPIKKTNCDLHQAPLMTCCVKQDQGLVLVASNKQPADIIRHYTAVTVVS